MCSVTTWNPCSFLPPLPTQSYILLLLNQPVENKSLLVDLWNSAVYRVTVDGGTNVWHQIINNSDLSVADDGTPDLITGDMDSVQMDNLEQFRSCGTVVVNTPDQDMTDFTKCLLELAKQRNVNPKAAAGEVILAFCETGGRMDQVMANINTLYLARDHMPSIPLYLVSSHSISCLLAPGQHKIETVHTNLHCGLIPLSGEAVVTSTGLKWDLTGQKMKFGDLISTSNKVVASKVTVDTDNFLLWTMDLPS